MAGQSLLLVEGTDDEHVVKHLCGAHNVGEIQCIKRQGGIDKLLEALPVQIKRLDDADRLGVLVDADTDILARWQALRDRLVQAGYTEVPERPVPSGTLIDAVASNDSHLPRVGLWLMPDNRVPGLLEDFLAFLVPEGDRLYERAGTTVDGIPDEERKFADVDRLKARMHTWLAWQEEPGKPYGTAIRARYLDPNLPEARLFAQWLRDLFFDPTADDG
jgi:hypothetical protein